MSNIKYVIKHPLGFDDQTFEHLGDVIDYHEKVNTPMSLEDAKWESTYTGADINDLVGLPWEARFYPNHIVKVEIKEIGKVEKVGR